MVRAEDHEPRNETVLASTTPFMRTPYLLATMVSLQVVWLLARWLTGTPPNGTRLPLLIVYAIIAGTAIGCMPPRLISRIRLLKERLVQNGKLPILTLCGVVLLAGVVSANFQVVFSDELAAFGASRIVAEKGVAAFFADYGRIWWFGSHHPPLVALVYGLAMRVFGVNLFVIRLVSVALTVATILLTYSLGSELYDRETGFVAALLLLSFRSFLHFGVAAMTDMPVTFFFAITLLLTLRLLRAPTYRLSAATGVLIGAGLLSKYTMALIYPVLLCYLAICGPFRRLRSQVGIMILVSICILAVWLAYADRIGALAAQRDKIVAYAGLGTTGDGRLMLASWWRMKVRLEALVRLPSALGVHSIPFLLLGGLHLLRRRDRSDLFILLWIAPVFMLLMLTLPDPRYFMPAFPGLAMVMARGLGRVPEAREQVIVLALLYCGGALYLFADW